MKRVKIQIKLKVMRLLQQENAKKKKSQENDKYKYIKDVYNDLLL